MRGEVEEDLWTKFQGMGRFSENRFLCFVVLALGSSTKSLRSTRFQIPQEGTTNKHKNIETYRLNRFRGGCNHQLWRISTKATLYFEIPVYTWNIWYTILKYMSQDLRNYTFNIIHLKYFITVLKELSCFLTFNNLYLYIYNFFSIVSVATTTKKGTNISNFFQLCLQLCVTFCQNILAVK